MKNYETIFAKLWEIYTKQNPQVLSVYNLLSDNGESVVNDHVALRTFDNPQLCIDILSKPFINSGYEFAAEYYFEDKNLRAKHFVHKFDKQAPRVFISELVTSKFDTNLQAVFNDIFSQIPQNILISDDLIFSGKVWGEISFKTYENLRNVSEYAAWLYVNGFRANHFTVSVNSLKKYNSVEKVNKLLKQNGFLLNDSGGEIKGNKSLMLEQSSIKAGFEKVKFLEGIFEIPTVYYEFAKRYTDKNGKLFDGFIEKSADKIFESTNFYNSEKTMQ